MELKQELNVVGAYEMHIEWTIQLAWLTNRFYEMHVEWTIQSAWLKNRFYVIETKGVIRSSIVVNCRSKLVR